MKKISGLVLGLSLFFVICAGGLFFAIQAMMPFMWILLATGLIGVSYFLYCERRLIFEFYKLKTTQNSLSMGTLFLAVVTILILINYLSNQYVRVFDFSMTSQYTLSDKTQKILLGLNKPLEIKYFYKEGLQNIDDSKKAFLAQANVFKVFSNLISVSVHEMNSAPQLAEKFGAQKGTGEGFIAYNGKINRIESLYSTSSGEVYAEQSFINAIIKISREKVKNIYFLSGHGEIDIDNDKLETGASFFKSALLKNSYKVETLNIINKGSIPDDTDLIIVAGGTQNFQKNESELIDLYLKKGRPLMLILQSEASQSLKNILSFTNWNLGQDYVFNLLNSQQGPMIATDQATVANQFTTDHIIAKNFNDQKAVLLFRPHPLVAKDISDSNSDSKNEESIRILQTSDQAIALSDLNTKKYSGSPKSFDMIAIWKGIYNKASKSTQIAIVSDVSLLWNQFFYQANNKDLSLNIVSYLALENDLISLEIKEPNKTPLKILGPEFNSYFRWIILLLFLPLPVLLLILTWFVWYKSRHA